MMFLYIIYYAIISPVTPVHDQVNQTLLGSLLLPFDCNYEEALEMPWNRERDYCMRFKTSYFECLTPDVNYRNPRYFSDSYARDIRCHNRKNKFAFCIDDFKEDFCMMDKQVSNIHMCGLCYKAFKGHEFPEITLEFNEGNFIVVIKNFCRLKTLHHGYMVDCLSDVKISTMDSYVYASGDDLFTYHEIYKKSSILKYILRPKQELLKFGAPGRFWCQGFARPCMAAVKSNVVFRNFSQYEYDFAVNITSDISKKNHLVIRESLYAPTILDGILLIRAVELFPVQKNNLTYQKFGFHFTMNNTKQSLREAIGKIEIAFQTTYIVDYIIASAEYCLEEYSEGDSGQKLEWPLTKIGETVQPINRQLTNNWFRNCEGDFLTGAYWSDPFEFSCNTIFPSKITTEQLEDILQSNMTSSEVVEHLEALLLNSTDFEPYDIFLTAQVLEKIARDNCSFSLKRIVNIISLIMDIDTGKLEYSQNNFTATDLILLNFDMILETAMQTQNISNIYAESANVALQITSLIDHEIVGVAFYEQNETNLVEFLTDRNIENLEQENLLFSVILPEKLLEQIGNTSNEGEKPYLVTAVFKRDNLFNEISNKRKPNSLIPSIFLHGFRERQLFGLIQVYLKPETVGDQVHICSFWNLSDMINKGNWVTGEKAKIFRNCRLCEFKHTTHFGLLVGSEDEVKSLALNIITAIGCCLSIIGILGIFLTVIVFNKWRYETGAKILVHFSFTILIQMTLLFIAGSVSGEKRFLCVFVGISLHYSILAQFFWVLVISYFQYRRFVNALSEEPKGILLKSCIIGWLLPGLLVLPVPLLNLEDYIHESYCYLNGNSLLYGILIPIAIIICVNLAMFFRIFFTMWCKKISPMQMTKQMKVQNIHLQIRLAVFLFFLMGFTWIFGLLSTFFDSPILSYFFCLTGTMQGLVLFIFHIILNKKIRYSWGKWIHSLKMKN